MTYAIAAFYKFTPFEDPAALQEPLRAQLKDIGVKGTVLLAAEGINGTMAVPGDDPAPLLDILRALPGCADLPAKVSFSDEAPFLRLKIKLKKEIVTIGDPSVDPNRVVGTYVEPEDWNALISDPDVLVIDTRNTYETAIGTFSGAIDPRTETFRQFPGYVAQTLDPAQHKKVAMFCTGGIRCEKASSFMRDQGFEEVYHLNGGILNYIEKTDPAESLWQGECFVFDDRVAVDHSLEPGRYDQCHGCRHPVTEDEKQHPQYEYGVSCHRCFDGLSEEKRMRSRQRQRQMEIAEARGQQHRGEAEDISGG